MPSKGKIKLFKALAIAIPFLVVLGIEFILRVFGIVPSLDLFVQDPNHPDYFVQNPYFSKRYFSDINKATIGFQEPFKKNKGDGTFRVVVQGASTAVGFPYFHNGSFHRMLKYRLQQSWPGRNIEVINVSLTAVNSYTLADQAEEIIAIQPDAVLIYAGHNEYYGALGVAASGGDLFSRIHLMANKLAIVQLINALVFTRDRNTSAKLTNNLMEKMAKEAKIPKYSKVYHRGIAQFEANMDALFADYADAHIPVFISTIASNQKDQPPFVSVVSVENEELKVKNLMDRAEGKLLESDYAMSSQLLLEALDIDSSYAATHYALGKLHIATGQNAKAKNAFVKAKEFDGLRFRAPDKINVAIEQLAKKHQANLVDSKALLESYSKWGMVGDGLMLEHLHPNLTGYGLISTAFYDGLYQYFKKDSSFVYVSHQDFLANYPATVVDTLLGEYAIAVMKEQWPFNQAADQSVVRGSSQPEKIAGMLLVKQATWDEAMEVLYQYYLSSEDQSNMLKVAEASAMEHPRDVKICATVGQLFAKNGNHQKALQYFKQAYEVEPNALLARKIAQAYIQLDLLDMAASYLHFSVQLDSKDNIAPLALSSIAIIEKAGIEIQSNQNELEPYLAMAIHYLKLEVPDKARHYFLKAKHIDSHNDIVKQLNQYFNHETEKY